MTSYTEELKSVHRKREAIENLISFTKQIKQMTKGLEAVKHIAKPSQLPKKRDFALMRALVKRLAHIGTPQLKTSLSKLDDAVKHDMESIVKISQISEENFFQLYISGTESKVTSSYDALVKELQNFRRKAQTDVAVRYVLHDRGVMLDCSRLSIDQEKLSQHVDDMKGKENKCRRRIRQEIQTLIADTNKIRNHPDLPNTLLEKMEDLNAQLTQVLSDLDAGKDIEEFSDSLEIVEIGQNNRSNNDLENEPTADKEESNELELTLDLDALEFPNKKRNFFSRLWFWLVTPWGVNWKDIK